MKTKKIVAIVLALVIVIGLAACGAKNGGKDNGKKNTGDVRSISVCLASEPDTIDPALNSAVDGATLLAHLFSGLAKWSQDAEGNLEIVADAAEELTEGVENEDTYKLRDGLKWSDGKDVTAGDYVFAW